MLLKVAFQITALNRFARFNSLIFVSSRTVAITAVLKPIQSELVLCFSKANYASFVIVICHVPLIKSQLVTWLSEF